MLYQNSATTRAFHLTTFNASHTELMMTSGELYGLIGNAMIVVTAEVIQIERRKGRKRHLSRGKFSNSGGQDH